MKGLLIVFYSIIFLACSPSEAKVAEEKIWIINEGWVAENNEDYFIQFPEDWSIKKNELGNERGFRLMSPKSFENDSLFENIVLYRQSVKQGTKVEYFGARTVNNNQFQYGRDYKLHSRKLIKEANQYYRIDATLKSQEQDIRGIQHIIIRERSVFVLSLYCIPETFDEYQIIGEKIMKSFIPKENFWIKKAEPYL